MSLTFDALTHTYRVNGVVVPSVTQLLSDLQDFSHVPAATMEAAQLRGTNVHLLCEYIDRDCLNETEFSAEERAFMPAWMRFLNDTRPNWRHIEAPGFNEQYGYAGTPDREGDLEALGIKDAIFDIKTSATRSPLWGLQTAGYARLRPRNDAFCRRFTIQLRPDGTYRLHEWTDPTDWPTFASLATLNRWIRKNLAS